MITMCWCGIVAVTPGGECARCHVLATEALAERTEWDRVLEGQAAALAYAETVLSLSVTIPDPS